MLLDCFHREVCRFRNDKICNADNCYHFIEEEKLTLHNKQMEQCSCSAMSNDDSAMFKCSCGKKYVRF